jgi:hypothetical protein
LKKILHAALFFLLGIVFVFLLIIHAGAATYVISPAETVPTVNISPGNGIVAAISSRANALFLEDGYRPPYDGRKFAPGTHLTPEQAESVAPYLLVCESGNKDGNACGIDSNGKPSCGRAQFQDWTTFWEVKSGITGDPLNGNDAIKMMLWALENGYIQRWSCAYIEKVL